MWKYIDNDQYESCSIKKHPIEELSAMLDNGAKDMYVQYTQNNRIPPKIEFRAAYLEDPPHSPSLRSL